ncbi:hypothetical protein Cni_G02645 [Canna indica]|uniref:Uncharacterized protein n=1 Tax=Canna indica TaxID=4628 RepID=A0AAQ3JRS8_9LILI|nr:hypothetical protein Cni_G02645 [Canna indica]
MNIEADQVQSSDVVELVHVSTLLEEMNNSRTITHDKVNDASYKEFNVSINSDAVDFNAMNVEADQTHEGNIVEHFHVSTTSEAQNNSSETSNCEQVNDGLCEDSTVPRNSIVANSDTVNVEADRAHDHLVVESIHDSSLSEAKKDNSQTSNHEQVNGSSYEDSNISLNSDVMNVEADQVHGSQVVELVHVSTPLEEEMNNSRTITYDKVNDGSCKESYVSINLDTVDSNTINVEADQTHEDHVVEPFHVSTTSEAQNNSSETSNREQVNGGLCEDSTVSRNSISVNSDTTNVEADQAHGNPFVELAHDSSLSEAKKDNSRTSNEQVNGSFYEDSTVSMNSNVIDSDAVNVETDQTHENQVVQDVSTSYEVEKNNSIIGTQEQVNIVSCEDSIVLMSLAAVDFVPVNVETNHGHNNNVEEFAIISTPILDEAFCTSDLAEKKKVEPDLVERRRGQAISG